MQNYRRLTRIPAPQLEPVRIHDLFTGVQHLLKANLAPQAIGFRMPLPDPNLCIDADPELIEQVLINLVKNGVEASRKGDTPCLAVTASPGPPGKQPRPDRCLGQRARHPGRCAGQNIRAFLHHQKRRLRHRALPFPSDHASAPRHASGQLFPARTDSV